jgi:diguanylate cyclase (GGDEF)-like protein
MSPFGRYTVVIGLLALAAIGPIAAGPWSVSERPLAFALLAALVVAGELLPIRIPGSVGFADDLTVSSAFALALLLMFGAAPGVAVYAGACLVADAVNRTARAKTAYNASQSVLAMAAAAATFALVAGHATVGSLGSDLGAVLAAAGAFATADNLLTAGAGAALSGSPPLRYLLDTTSLHMGTQASLLALVPVAIAAGSQTAWIVPLLFVPIVGIWLGGRQALVNARRALYDDTTGLPSHALLGARLEDAIGRSRRDDTPLAVAVIELGDVKPVADSLGPAAADSLIAQVAERLGSTLAPGDELGRVGADRLAVVLGGGDRGVAPETRVARAVEDALAAPLAVGELTFELRAHVGIAELGDPATAAETLLGSAAAAAAEAARTGAGWLVHARDETAEPADRLRLAVDLRRGIERGELFVEYQVKRALAEGGSDAVEALVRWTHPTFGPLSPAAFVPLAEQIGLIGSLTRWVLDEAVRQCAEWRALGTDVRVAVNLSARDVLDPRLPGEVERLLAQHGLPGSALQLEITETQVLGDAADPREALERLAALGVTCAIDDFGTGYSSLAQLQRLPVDEIKIDRSFVSQMDASASDAAIVRSTIDLARSLGLRVTAEGVETPAALARLAALGCDYAQGYHVARPMSARDCIREIDGHRGAPRPSKLRAVAYV